MPLSSSAPVASTSRIPYAPPANPAQARALHTSRPFFSPRRSASARAHLIHPLARQRLTNLSFLLAGALSVVTVSLGMSGTFGDAAPGCPARKDARVSLEGAEAYGPSGGRGEPRKRNEAAGDAGWWKGKGRFLDDPVVPAQQAHGAAAPRGAYVPPARSAQAQAHGNRDASAAPLPAVPPSGAAVESARSVAGGARIGGRAAEPQQQHGTGGWTSWMGTNERVV
ncbi:hypothetical protein Rhopal_004568-T1 [Rhodotorula paludigena]|uniref:Uncharacterized protein n=1 Tax=Rhodotorula paludigena TaxID=86838 RepID=A0AAV5GPV5_9BASI|nr:hypothetical protein Rhopal_004568-T1 [Rhodotorula paludigena]